MRRTEDDTPSRKTEATGRSDDVLFLGNESDGGRELWLSDADCRRHLLVLGTTGAGKTELLIGLAANALSWGSGFLICDGKGDVALFDKVYALARRLGREDDLLVLNFMTDNADAGAMAGKARSNSFNPFAIGTAESLITMMLSLMDDCGGRDGVAMWKNRAAVMLTGVMRALCSLRDQGILVLDVGALRDAMALRRIIELGDETLYPGIDQDIRMAIHAYLTSLPGYQADKREKQAQTTLDNHCYLEMQFTKILSSMADVYGHVFGTAFGDVDMDDVVLNRRLLVVLLPALERSWDEIANLGKIVSATLTGMMGGKPENSQAFGSRPAPPPFVCVLDEVGYYVVNGLALSASRSPDLCMAYASQDVSAMRRLNKNEADAIISTTHTKIFMGTEEPSRIKNSGTSDLKAMGPGDMHVMVGDKLLRAHSFYTDPASTLDIGKLALRINQFIAVPIPTAGTVAGWRAAAQGQTSWMLDRGLKVGAHFSGEAEATTIAAPKMEEGSSRRFSLTGERHKMVFRFLGKSVDGSLGQGVCKLIHRAIFGAAPPRSCRAEAIGVSRQHGSRACRRGSLRAALEPLRNSMIGRRKEWEATPGPSLVHHQATKHGAVLAGACFDPDAAAFDAAEYARNSFGSGSGQAKISLPSEAPQLTPAYWLLFARVGLTAKNGLDRSAAAAVFRQQLGGPWNGIAAAPPHVQAICVMAALNRQPHRARDLSNLAALLAERYTCHSFAEATISVRAEMAHHLADEFLVSAIDRRGGNHAHTNAAMIAIFGWGGPMAEWGGGDARVFSTATIRWLKRIDRPLFYALNNVGRRRFHIEGAGAISHYFAERTVGGPVSPPMVEAAVDGLADHLREAGISDLKDYFCPRKN